MAQLAGVPTACPHCRQPTHGILLCPGCGRLTTAPPQKAPAPGHNAKRPHARHSNTPKDKARRAARMAEGL